MIRKIIHLDLDAFFCAVEELQNPALIGSPFAVGGRPESRGVISSCSYAARAFGVRSAMPTAHALRLCPDLLIISPHHRNYSQISDKVIACMRRLTPLVEQISIDEAFIDVSDLPESAESIARQLQATVHTELRLPCSLGVATNKLLAKTATDVGKIAARGSGPPNAITIVPPGSEAEFLSPLPAQALWGVGPRTAERLKQIGVETVGDIANLPEAELVSTFGKHGRDLALRARGLDDRPVITFHEPKSVSQETTFARDVSDPKVLITTLTGLSESVARRLRSATLSAITITLKIRWPDFTTLTRQMTLSQSTDQDSEITLAAVQLFNKVWKSGRAVRLLGVGASGLRTPVRQLSLWEEQSEKEHKLLGAIDEIHSRYGKDKLYKGSRAKR